MSDLLTMLANERRNDLYYDAQRVRRGNTIYPANGAPFRAGRRAVGRALIRAGQAVSEAER